MQQFRSGVVQESCSCPHCGSGPVRLHVPSMGNQIDRITHLNYSELPTGDPSGLEKDELRVGVAYFFSDEEDEGDERAAAAAAAAGPPAPAGAAELQRMESSGAGAEVAPQVPAGGGVAGELEYSAFCRQECIFSKLSGNQDLQVHSLNALLPRCRAGDLLELTAHGQAAHWAVYVGGDQVVHLQHQEIRLDHLAEVGAAAAAGGGGGGRAGRIVNTWYRYRALPPELVVQNARGHLGLKGRDICWTDSESFAAWCRFGKREFKAGGEVPGGGGGGGGDRRYFLKLHLSDNWVHTLNFASLQDLIREKRRKDACGKIRVLKELSILNHK
ncbi:protein LRATD1 isoform X2 [Chiloscyllium plagiosum]|uniref:protein LRATD1 isoform X2 n=1 Tax=Chiloscyllium plagiosum TaxID=36176 RepID=UPI001CB871AD|nr:protein LRATD1 isoform X2 [Chiloscyllium plagiosum]